MACCWWPDCRSGSGLANSCTLRARRRHSARAPQAHFRSSSAGRTSRAGACPSIRNSSKTCNAAAWWASASTTPHSILSASAATPRTTWRSFTRRRSAPHTWRRTTATSPRSRPMTFSSGCTPLRSRPPSSHRSGIIRAVASASPARASSPSSSLPSPSPSACSWRQGRACAVRRQQHRHVVAAVRGACDGREQRAAADDAVQLAQSAHGALIRQARHHPHQVRPAGVAQLPCKVDRGLEH